MKATQSSSTGGDHSTDFQGMYGDIGLAYGLKSGFSSYGPKFSNPGARFWELTFDETTGKVGVETWVQ